MTSLLAVAFAPSFVALAAANLAVGMTAVSAQVIIPAISGLVPPERRGRTLGTLMSGVSAGLLFARTLSGFVGTHASWQAMFGIAVGVDAALILTVALRLPRTERTGALSYPALMGSLWPLLRREPILRAACITGFFMFASFSALWSTVAVLLARPPFEMRPDAIGAFGFVGIAGLFALPWIGRAVDAVTARPVLAGGALTISGAFLLLSQTESHPWTLIIAMMAIDVGNRASLISNQSRIYGLPSGLRSRLNTVFMTSYFLGGATGAAAAALAVDQFGWHGLAAAGVGFSAAALVGHLAVIRFSAASTGQFRVGVTSSNTTCTRRLTWRTRWRRPPRCRSGRPPPTAPAPRHMAYRRRRPATRTLHNHPAEILVEQLAQTS